MLGPRVSDLREDSISRMDLHSVGLLCQGVEVLFAGRMLDIVVVVYDASFLLLFSHLSGDTLLDTHFGELLHFGDLFQSTSNVRCRDH